MSQAPTTARVLRGAGICVDSPASALVDALEDLQDADVEDHARGVELARAALRHDPGCIEALVYLADLAESPEAAVGLLRKAVAAGAFLWDPVAALPGGLSWWWTAATRPYMRAISGLGDAYRDAGDTASAMACYERLVRMDPDDHLGARDAMVRLSACTA